MKQPIPILKNKTRLKPNVERGDKIAKNPGGRPRKAVFAWPIYDTLGQASAHSKVPVAVLKEAKKLGCPAFKHSRVHFEEFLPWIFSTLMDDKATNWGSELKRAQAMRERIKLAEDEGRVVDRNTIAEGISKSVALMFGELDRVFISELPARGKGMDEIALRKLSTAEIEKIKIAMRQKLEPMTKSAA